MTLRKTFVWTLPLLMGTAWATEEAGPEAAVTKLLSQAKTQAFQVKEDAVTMESFNRMTVSRETQKASINQLRDDINALVLTENKLQAAREDAPAWQQKVIARIIPFLDELNGYTSAVIEHLNGETPHTFAEYKDYLEANADYSTDLAKMIADFVDYGRTKDRLEHLSDKLEISSAK
jgi:predicted sulfurtransferase